MRIPPDQPPDGHGYLAVFCASAVAALLVADLLIYVFSSYGARKVGPNGLAELKGLSGAPPRPVLRHNAKPTLAAAAVVVSDGDSRLGHARPRRFRRYRYRPRSSSASGGARTASAECASAETCALPPAPAPKAAPAPQAKNQPSSEPVRVAGSTAIEPPVEQP